MQTADSVAQLVEHLPFKERVLGSSPSRITKVKRLPRKEVFFYALKLKGREACPEEELCLQFNFGKPQPNHQIKKTSPNGGLFCILIHGISIGRFLRNLLNSIPVFDDFSFAIESEKIHRNILFTFWPLLVGMKCN